MELYDKRGKRLQTNLIKVCMRRNGQYMMTIPKKIALRAKLVDGSIVLVEFDDFHGIVVKKAEVFVDGEEIR